MTDHELNQIRRLLDAATLPPTEKNLRETREAFMAMWIIIASSTLAQLASRLGKYSDYFFAFSLALFVISGVMFLRIRLWPTVRSPKAQP
jgi:hypothetical protein